MQAKQQVNKILYRLAYLALQVLWRVTRPVTMGVRLLLVKEDQVLLVKHTYQDEWFIPGGGVKRGETLEQAARREASEEAGATLGRLRLFGIYTQLTEGKSDHVIVFACEDFSVAGAESPEIENCRFFPLGGLPAKVSPGCRRRIDEYARPGWQPAAGEW